MSSDHLIPNGKKKERESAIKKKQDPRLFEDGYVFQVFCGSQWRRLAEAMTHLLLALCGHLCYRADERLKRREHSLQ